MKKQFDTLAVRAGQVRTHEGEHSDPIFMTSSYVFASAQEAAARFAGDQPGNIYSRFTNPTVRTFETRLAAMEGGQACVATASGMSAILALCLGVLQAGDHMVSSRSIFGSTTILFNTFLAKLGIQTTYVDLTDLDQWSQAINRNTKMLFLETPSNPLMHIADLPALSALAKQHDCLLAVDNCFCSPSLQQPLALGADVVVHSATKYIDGQGRCLGGAVIGSEEIVGKQVYAFLRSAGPTLSPFHAWIFLSGLETLSLRMQKHCDNAQTLAEWLCEQPQVEQVYYPGLPEHPQHALAASQQQGFGGIVSFQVNGGQAHAYRVINSTDMLSITANLGDSKTTITHPASTTHGRLSDAEKAAASITPGLIRIAVGLENIDDIINDIKEQLTA